MRAILLSAGRGERLRPLTDTIPKVMIDVNGKPLLQHWIEKLKKSGVTEIAINTHWMGDKIKNYFGDGNKFGVKIFYSEEEVLLGTASPLKRIERIYPRFCSEESFLVIYSDNLTDMNLEEVKKFHEEKDKPITTITLHSHDELWTRGIVDIDESGKVKCFIEKPPKEDILSGKYTGESASCVMILEPEILNYLKEDLGDLFPRLLKEGLRIYAFNPHAIVEDTGTPERYERTKRIFKDIPEFN